MIDKSWYIRQPGMPESITAGGVVVRLTKGNIYVALVRNGSHTAYILPKGRLEKGESLKKTARREVLEEAGLSKLRLLGFLEKCERQNFKKTHWKYIHFYLFITKQIKGVPTDPKHHYKLKWAPIDKLPPMLWPEQRALIKNNRKRIKRFVKKFAK